MTEVTINRHSAADNFSILRNEVVRDDRLSWKATGILCWLLGLPQDWRVRLSHLADQKTDGRDSTRAGLAELETAGYLWIERRRDGGRFERVVWHVTDTPEAANFPQKSASKPANSADLPRSGIPNAANPASGRPTLQRTKGKKHLGKKELIQEPPPQARKDDEQDSATGAGGGVENDCVYQAARKGKLSPAVGREVAALAAGAEAKQVAWLAKLLEQLPSQVAEGRVKKAAGYARELARRAVAGQLTQPEGAAAALSKSEPEPPRVYKTYPQQKSKGDSYLVKKMKEATARA